MLALLRRRRSTSNTLPFVNVARLLEQMPVPIPQRPRATPTTSACSRSRISATSRCRRTSARPRRRSTRRSIARRSALIATLQRRGAELESPEYLPYRIAFDVEKLTWEMDFFTKHFIEAYRGVVISPAAREALREEFALIIEELAGEPRVLCHRDYHSRNLMLHEDRLYIIDFQDARMGPDTYDLVSLLRDSVRRSAGADRQRADRLLPRAQGRDASTEAEFRDRFDVMALQRNLKALGTFGYQTTARRNPVYIQYIPRTLRYVRDNLERHAAVRPAARRSRGARRGVPVTRTANGAPASVQHRESRAALTLDSPVHRCRLQPAARSAWYNQRFAISRKRLRVHAVRDFHAPLSRPAARPQPPRADRRRTGSRAIELFATRSHFDYRDRAAGRRAGGLAVGRPG